MLYKEAFLADSLSRLIHVEILQENSEVIQSADFEIQKGKISGGLVLAKDMKPGDYMIRAYTHWNHNFPEGDQFTFPLIIMEEGYRPELETDESKFPQGTIEVNSDITLTDSLNYRSDGF